MKKLSLFLAFCLIICLMPVSDNLAVNDSVITNVFNNTVDGISIQASADKAEYVAGDEITITYIIKNKGDKAIYQAMSPGNKWYVDFYLIQLTEDGEDGETIRCFEQDFGDVKGNKLLGAGKLTSGKITASDVDLESGKYKIVAAMEYGYDNPDEVVIDETNQPVITAVGIIKINGEIKHSISKNGVNFEATINKDVFVPGESIFFTCLIDNTNDKPIYQYMANGNQRWVVDIILVDKDGKEYISHFNQSQGDFYANRMLWENESYIYEEAFAYYQSSDYLKPGKYTYVISSSFDFEEHPEGDVSDFEDKYDLELTGEFDVLDRTINYSNETYLTLTGYTHQKLYQYGDDIELTYSVRYNRAAEPIYQHMTPHDIWYVDLSIIGEDGKEYYPFGINDDESLSNKSLLYGGSLVKTLRSDFSKTEPLPTGKYQYTLTTNYTYTEPDDPDAENADFTKTIVKGEFSVMDNGFYSKGDNNLKILANTDDKIYAYGEKINIDAVIENKTDNALYQVMSSGEDWHIDISLADAKGNEYNLTEVAPDAVLSNKTLAANNNPEFEFELLELFKGDLPAGEYTCTLKTSYGLENPEENHEVENTNDVALDLYFAVAENTDAKASDESVELTATFNKPVYTTEDNVRIKLDIKNISDHPIYQYDANITGYLWVTAKIIDAKTTENVGYLRNEDLNSALPTFSCTKIVSDETNTINLRNYQTLTAGKYIVDIAFSYANEYSELISLESNTETLHLLTSFEVFEKSPTDLMISSVNTDSSAIAEDEEFGIRSTVRNVGENDYIGSVTVDYYLSGKVVSTVTEDVFIKAGEFVVINSDEATRAAFGSQRISAMLSCDDGMDNDDMNNIAKTRIIVD